MSVEIRQLRALVAVIDAGSFTDAAIELGVSQAAVSRNVASLETELGVRLLRRTTRTVAPTPVGAPILARARRLLADLESLVNDAATGHDRLRVGYAWSAVGRHTVALQRQWPIRRPDTELLLVRNNSASGGLTEGSCEMAILRNTPDARRFDSVTVGLERRFCVMATDDPLARKRSVSLADFADRNLGIDRRTGTTTVELWAGRRGPNKIIDTLDIDDWLGLIATGGTLGMTTEATVALYPRPGVAYRPVRDAPPIAVHLAWWRSDPPPATGDLVDVLTTLYREG